MRLTVHLKNILFLYSGDAFSRFVGMAAVAYLARILGPSDFGTISIGLAVLSYGVIVGNSGLSVLGTRKVAANAEDVGQLTVNILSSRLFLSVMAYTAGVIIAKTFIASIPLSRLTIIYLAGVFPAAFLLDWFFQGTQKLKIVAGGQLAGMVCYLLFVLAFVKTPENIVWVAWAWVAGMLVNTIFLWIKFKYKNVTLYFLRNRLNVLSLLKEAFPLGIAAIIAQFVTQFPVIYLGLVATRADVGLFSAGLKFVFFLLIFDRIFYAVFFPNISRCFRQFPEKLEENVNHVLKLTTAFVLVVSMVAVLSGNFLVLLIYGKAFSGAVPIFQIMSGLFVLKLINSVFTFTLIGIEKEKVYTKALIWGLGTFLLMIIILTKPMGSIGVVFALIGFEIVSLMIMVFELKRYVILHFTRSVMLPIFGTLCFLWILLFYIEIVFFLKLAVAFIAGVPLIVWLGGIGLDDIRYLKRIFI